LGVILEAVPARCPAAVLLLVEYEGPMTVVLERGSSYSFRALPCC
jgi:hypothetical protein